MTSRNLSWQYKNADIDPSHQEHGVLLSPFFHDPVWIRNDGLSVALCETRLQNLYNLQIYLDKRMDSEDYSFDSIQTRFFDEWSKKIIEEIKSRSTS
jgi:hypothetical protein